MEKINNAHVSFYISNPLATVPQYAHEGDAGLDLVSIEDHLMRPGETWVFKLGFSMVLPAGIEAQIRTRSGNAIKGLIVVNSPGTIDPNYRGEIGVILKNTGEHSVLIHGGTNGTKIAQMVLAPFITMNSFSVAKGNAPLDTERGEGGFGSTGETRNGN